MKDFCELKNTRNADRLTALRMRNTLSEKWGASAIICMSVQAQVIPFTFFFPQPRGSDFYDNFH